jgi:hypothetical protein
MVKPTLLKVDWSKVWTWSELWAWSEVWALILPLIIVLTRRNRIAAHLRPVAYYIFIALFLNIIADFIWRFQRRLSLPEWMWDNSSIYHIHSIVRLLLFGWFFNLLGEPFLVKIKKIIPLFFILFVVTDFIILKPLHSFFTGFHSELLATEAAILLFYCLQHYIYQANLEQISSRQTRSTNRIIAGLTIYIAINFFIFLFYSALMETSNAFSRQIWEVHNISYILFSCLIANGFYESDKS